MINMFLRDFNTKHLSKLNLNYKQKKIFAKAKYVNNDNITFSYYWFDLNSIVRNPVLYKLYDSLDIHLNLFVSFIPL